VTHALQLITKSRVCLDILCKWSWGSEPTRALVLEWAKQSMRAYKLIQYVVALVDRLYGVLANKKAVSSLLKEPKHKETKIFQYFWQICMDTLYELKVVSEAWNNVRLRFLSWGRDVFEGPMALDLFLRWPENKDRDTIRRNILGAFCEILFFSGKYNRVYTSSWTDLTQ